MHVALAVIQQPLCAFGIAGMFFIARQFTPVCPDWPDFLEARLARRAGKEKFAS